MHTTTNTSYTLTKLPCGQRYAFRIAVQDGQTHSSYGPATEISTGKKKDNNNSQVSCSRSIIDGFSLFIRQLPVSLPTSQLAWTVEQTTQISPGLKQVMQVSTLLR